MKIDLDNPREPYRPGQAITGRLLLGPQDNLIQKLHLVLEGRAKTKTVEQRGESRNVYRARAPILYQLHPLDMKTIIFDGPNTSLVPFTVYLPREVPEIANVPTTKDGMFRSYWNYDWGKPKDPFRHEAGHSLPPSFQDGPHGVYTVSQCYVEYSITAVGSRMKSGQVKPGAGHLQPQCFDTKPFWLQSTCPVAKSMFEPSRRGMRQHAQRINIQTIRLQPDIGARDKGKLTLKEKFKNAMSSSKLPEINFIAALKVPTYLQVGETMDMTVRLERTDSGRTLGKNGEKARPQVPFPDVHFDSMEIKMKHTTHVRTCGTMNMHSDNWNETVWTDVQRHGVLGADLPKWAGDAPPDYSSVCPSPSYGFEKSEHTETDAAAVSEQPSNQSYQIFKLSSRSPISTRLTPTFSTYNISRSYNVRVTVAFSCAGEKKFINYSGPVTIHSQPLAISSPRAGTLVDPNGQEMQSDQVIAGSSASYGMVDLSITDVDGTTGPAERIDSGIGSPEKKHEDWGESKLTHDDEVAWQAMAGSAIEALGTTADLANIKSKGL